MGIEDIVNKAKDVFTSDKAEQLSDSVLDKAAGAANAVTGDKFSEKVDEVRDQVDGKVGND